LTVCYFPHQPDLCDGVCSEALKIIFIY